MGVVAMPFGYSQKPPEPSVAPVEEPVDERARPGQMITNGLRLWEILPLPAGPQNGIAWAVNVATNHALWLDLETIQSCRIVYPELGLVPA